MAEIIPQSRTQEWHRAYFLVGRFIGHWALMESAVDNGVGKLLGMDTTEATIATANMQLRSKLHIIKTVVALRNKTEWGKAALKDIEQIGTLADTWRNVVAHVPFGPVKGGVRFLSVKAKGKLTFPKIVRTEAEFKEVSEEMDRLAGRVEEIVARVSRTRGLAAAIAAYTNVSSQVPSAVSLPSHPLPGFLGFVPPTSETGLQTALEPEE